MYRRPSTKCPFVAGGGISLMFRLHRVNLTHSKKGLDTIEALFFRTHVVAASGSATETAAAI